ncbi:DNA cytosine methyltransferase [Actinokineospora sp. NBRC 105648]|uniref:DNA cytosine methyltransferase n=1 Tax=Actinokineospora sp. NBRC 105648 TaxID=3032206 RepID=UPI0024A3AC7E|nr:DNA cytosine methyltransferase [Actinokineospora sp. NBRC 105648]GLZ43610.1 hypothetical protein Acsp05_72340 [Actinokineospora sp. NBRC 105648]
MAVYGVKLLRSDVLKLADHPQACTEDTFAQWCAERVSMGARLAVDLFSGAGGLSLGMTDAGWTVAASVDHNGHALNTHRANFPGLALNMDLGDPACRKRLVQLLGAAEIDLIAGGPPCQPFSRAGRSKIRSLVNAGLRDEHDERKDMWRAYLDVVLRVRPRAVLMENVPDMALGDDFFVVRNIVESLESAGYRTQLRLVDAWRYGVPQHRKRLIVLARRDSDEFSWPETGPEVTVRDAIEDLPALGDTTGARQLGYREPDPLADFAAKMRKGAPAGVVFDHMTRPVRDDDREIFEGMTSRTLYADIAEHLRRYKSDTFDDKYKRLDWDERSRSITAHIAKDGYWYIHPKENRTLTVREAARIQTFPDWFRFAGTRSHAFQQIGNAVPPKLGEAAATALVPLPERPKSRINRWRALRGRLTAWALQQREGTYWSVFPGPRIGPATAAVVTLLDPSPMEVYTLNPVFVEVAARGRISVKAVRLVEQAGLGHTPTAAVKAARTAQEERRISWHAEDLPDLLDLKPKQVATLRLLAGDDVLLSGDPVLRVAARVLDTRSDKTNSLTDGRVDLARLVGGGTDAPLRMAAIRLISQLYCVKNNPVCGQCPLASKCAFAQRGGPSGLLF